MLNPKDLGNELQGHEHLADGEARQQITKIANF